MRHSSSKTICVCLLLVCCFGNIHGQSRGSFSVPSISDILNDAMNLERAAANFDQSATNGNQQGAGIPGSISGGVTDHHSRQGHGNGNQHHGTGPSLSIGNPIDHGVPPVITDAAGNAPPVPVGTHVDMPFEHGNNNPWPVIHRESTPLSGPHQSSDTVTGSHRDVHSQGTHPATNPFTGQHQEIGPRPDLHQPTDPALSGNVHLIPPGSHLDFPNEHGNNNGFPVLHVDSNPTSGQQSGANHHSRGNRGPTLIDIRNLTSADFHGMSVHQTAPEFQADRGGFLDLGSTHQDPSSIFPGAGSTLGGIASDIASGPLGIGNFPSGPTRPIDMGVNGHHGNPHVTPGFHHQPRVNIPVQPVDVSPIGLGVATSVGGHDSHAHEGIHIDAPGVHGNQLNEAALHVPDGMTMTEIHESGVLDALADTRAMAERGSSSASSPPTNVIPPNPFGIVGTVPGFPIDTVVPSVNFDGSGSLLPGWNPNALPVEPILPVVPIGLPVNSDNVPVRPGRRGRQGRRRRWRNRNGRRGRGRRIRPALEPVDVSIDQSRGHVHPTHAGLPVQPPTQHNLVRPGFIHSSSGNVAIVPTGHPTNAFGGITGSLFPNQIPGFPGSLHNRNVARVPGHGRRHGGGPASGGLLGELMRTAVQIGSNGPRNSPVNTGSLFGSQHQNHRGRNSPVQITRSGPMASGSHFHQQPSGVLVRGGQINPFGQQNRGQSDQLRNLQTSLGSTLFNMLGGMLG